jgi:uncharacterized low-complexity protein
MEKAKFNTKWTIATALMSALLMIVLVVGYTTEKGMDSDNNAISSAQLNDNVLAELSYDGKCDGDKDAEKKAKDEGKADKKSEKSSKEFAGEADKKKDGGESETKEQETKSDEAKEAKCGEGKCGEGKCGGDEKAKEESKCGEGKCGM